MEVLISLIALISALFFSSKVLLHIDSNSTIIKIGICRTISKLLIGLGVGFVMGLLLNLTQQYKSIALELLIIIPSLITAIYLSLKAYQYLVQRFTGRKETLGKLLIANLSEVAITALIIAVLMFTLKMLVLA